LKPKRTRRPTDQEGYDKAYWFLFVFAILLMIAGVMIEVFYYYIPRMERTKASAHESIEKTKKDIEEAETALEGLPADVRKSEKKEIAKSIALLNNAQSMYESGGMFTADIYEKAQGQAVLADAAPERTIKNGTLLGNVYKEVVTSTDAQKMLNAVADYCDDLETAYPKAQVPGEIINKASKELLTSADTHFSRLKNMVDNNKAWESDLTQNQNTGVDLKTTDPEETDFLDRMSTVCRKTRQKDDLVRIFYLLYKASREGELYGRVKVKPDSSTNLLDYWSSDLNKVREHNASISTDLTEAEQLLKSVKGG